MSSPWQDVKDAAQKVKDALDKAAHTSPADAISDAKRKMDALIAWADAKIHSKDAQR